MEEEALIWFQEAKEAGQFTSWEAFVRALHIRFGANTYDDPMETLTRLRQVSSVALYKGQFEASSNRIKELSEKHKLSCFLSDLKNEIRLLVRKLNPQNLSAAFGLAKIQEEYLGASRRNANPKPWNEGIKNSILGPTPMIKNDPKGSKLLIQKISPAQMEERRKKGLCYYCEDKWQIGHKCRTSRIFLMEGLQEVPKEGEPNVQLEEVSDVYNSQQELHQFKESRCPEGFAEITLYALLGSPSLGTMRVWSRINYQNMVILIDSGSTHYFLDEALLKLLKLPILTQDCFKVKVANGDVLQTKEACHEVQIRLQRTFFQIRLYSLGHI
ncbi:hypothetical protein SO802_033879 [Lithocarpus litseifolius]|uniref:Retrotransposon gag domain-containing protein n=1 Tax=Lithocarpus litseifolius TaxID=425828 RepID=A0AAW2BEC1_9ROSI